MTENLNFSTLVMGKIPIIISPSEPHELDGLGFWKNCDQPHRE